ncbi:MAG: class I poly(R)-hydroxyalkanoic acid synthase [Alphaproteobacteria bacterium]|nr:class I poly(R)-hydroxyalkanoic acid synthase [Alphaproteobacteria bacterium]
MPDPLALSQALMNAYQKSQPLFAEMIENYNKEFAKKQSEAAANPLPFNMVEPAFDLLGTMASHPMKYWAMQMEHAQKQADLWQSTIKKMAGEDVPPVIEPPKGDRRFRAAEWEESPFFDFIKQYYLLACDLVNKTIENTTGLSEKKKDTLAFTARLIMDALSPSNFVFTNPEVLHETIKTGGANLVKGLENFNRDLERGQGELDIKMSDPNAFTLGKDIATTEGQVVYENDLMQLIQYAPKTQSVFERPLLITPPWINKYYILDLRPENSYIKWALEQGHTVFCISWVNPDTKLAKKTFEDYMREGPLTALEQIEKITGEKECNAVGYCLGGTLLATTLAYLECSKKRNPITSATFLTTLVDFEHAGDMKLFMGDQQIDQLDELMRKSGVLPASNMRKTFSLLRANDLIWSFVVNNYLMGKEPFPFDLLYWNDDSTNMPASMHSFYLKNMYRDNLLTQPGGIEIGGVKIDIRKIKTPCYFLSTKDDHIAPWKATYQTTQLVSGPKVFTLAASGHIAGVINPPVQDKYCFWSAQNAPANPDKWLENAEEQNGSWWPHWQSWIETYAGDKTSPRMLKKGLEAAPGRYVRMRGD